MNLSKPVNPIRNYASGSVIAALILLSPVIAFLMVIAAEMLIDLLMVGGTKRRRARFCSGRPGETTGADASSLSLHHTPHSASGIGTVKLYQIPSPNAIMFSKISPMTIFGSKYFTCKRGQAGTDRLKCSQPDT